MGDSGKATWTHSTRDDIVFYNEGFKSYDIMRCEDEVGSTKFLSWNWITIQDFTFRIQVVAAIMKQINLKVSNFFMALVFLNYQ